MSQTMTGICVLWMGSAGQFDGHVRTGAPEIQEMESGEQKTHNRS